MRGYLRSASTHARHQGKKKNGKEPGGGQRERAGRRGREKKKGVVRETKAAIMWRIDVQEGSKKRLARNDELIACGGVNTKEVMIQIM